MNNYVENQLSFDDPVPIAIPEALAADPLVIAIALHEDAKAAVKAVSDPYNAADVALIAIKRERDAAKKLLTDKQLEMDSVARNKHELSKRRDAAISTMNQITEHLINMGAKPWGNNQYVTPAQLEAWQQSGVSPFGESFPEAAAKVDVGSLTFGSVQTS